MTRKFFKQRKLDPKIDFLVPLNDSTRVVAMDYKFEYSEYFIASSADISSWKKEESRA
jgi:hypothetical protein